jgi:DNA-binding NarL/FixJ family response regulator
VLRPPVRQHCLARPGVGLRGAAAVSAAVAPRWLVADMAAEGYGQREITQMLCVTPKTVEVHRSNADGKLGISSREACRRRSPAWPATDGKTQGRFLVRSAHAFAILRMGLQRGGACWKRRT